MCHPDLPFHVGAGGFEVAGLSLPVVSMASKVNNWFKRSDPDRLQFPAIISITISHHTADPQKAKASVTQLKEQERAVRMLHYYAALLIKQPSRHTCKETIGSMLKTMRRRKKINMRICKVYLNTKLLHSNTLHWRSKKEEEIIDVVNESTINK